MELRLMWFLPVWLIQRLLGQPPQLRERIKPLTPIGRVAGPEDVARAIAMYVSDDCQFITGAYIPVNGGMSMN